MAPTIVVEALVRGNGRYRGMIAICSARSIAVHPTTRCSKEL